MSGSTANRQCLDTTLSVYPLLRDLCQLHVTDWGSIAQPQQVMNCVEYLAQLEECMIIRTRVVNQVQNHSP